MKRWCAITANNLKEVYIDVQINGGQNGQGAKRRDVRGVDERRGIL